MIGIRLDAIQPVAKHSHAAPISIKNSDSHAARFTGVSRAVRLTVLDLDELEANCRDIHQDGGQRPNWVVRDKGIGAG